MIAALVAAMGGVVVAADCGDPLECPFVYRVKLAGKTVAAAATASNKVTCVDGQCWVKPASLRIAGYFYGTGTAGTATCGDAPCECKAKEAYVANYVFWDANKREVKFDAVASKYGGLTHTTDGTVVTEGTKRTTGTEGTEKSSNRERVRDLTHLGNIGNITTQQLINEEIKLWRWNFIQELLNDVKDFLTIPVYD